MSCSLQATAMFAPGFLRLGRLHLPVYGVFAAAGLIAALWLSQRTAPSVGLVPEKLWDAGVFAVIAAFVTSRVLLVAFDPRAFLQYPLLVLALPSLTYAGMALTGLATWVYLRWKRLPVKDVLDAWAPCAALLAATLSVAHFVEGTNAGMPTGLPWGVHTPGDTVLGRVHPVQIYSAMLGLVLCTALFGLLRRREFAGEVAAIGLIAGGLASFLVDMLRQPVESYGNAWLDPGQFLALGAILAGVLLLHSLGPTLPKPQLTREEVAVILENFLSGKGGRSSWDHFLSKERFSDPVLVHIQRHCSMLGFQIPVEPGGSGWSNDQGLEIMRGYVRQLRSDGEQSTKELS